MTDAGRGERDVPMIVRAESDQPYGQRQYLVDGLRALGHRIYLEKRLYWPAYTGKHTPLTWARFGGMVFDFVLNGSILVLVLWFIGTR